MREKELAELDIRSFERDSELASRAVKKFSKEDKGTQIVKYLYPEIPWARGERAYMNPYFSRYLWTVIPFYDCPIIAVTPSTAEDFKRTVGLNVTELLELWRKGRIYPLVVWPCESFSGKEFEHLHPILERNPPVDREFHFLVSLAGKEFYRYRDEALKLNPLISDWPTVYALLCVLGFRERVRKGCDSIRSTKNRKLIHLYTENWLGWLKHLMIIPPFLGALSPMGEEIRDLIAFPLKGGHFPNQVFSHEVAECLVRDLAFIGPADTDDLNIDLLIETQDQAKDLRKAYTEFSKHVNDFEVQEALETRDALEQVAEEYRRSAPFLDKASRVVHGGISISAAAVTYAAFSSFVSPWIAGLVAGSQVYTSLKSEEVKEWTEGKYARLLGKIGRGPFSFIHTWRAHKIVEKKK